jgi:chemosensory pili system protein ChpA (sensor histidine kinase/response regulator)
MDVVKTKLNEIRGAINTDSTLGKGTTFTIRLPLTLSISKALCCISDHAPIAFPMDGVGEVLDNLPVDRIITQPDGRSFVQWRDREVPYQPLRDLFTYNRMSRRSQMYGASSDDDTISVVVLRSAGSYLAVSVDSIVGEQEIVIKQLEGPIPKPSGITGATVMGDGRIVPIADVLELIDLSMGRVRHEAGSLLWDDRTTVEAPAPQAEKSEPLVLIVDDSITVRELLSMTFKKSGYRVEQARDGQEAWEKLRSGLPCELVFCDMEMPRMNGMELLEKMHGDEYLSDLPIAMLTSRTAEKMKKKAAEFGARGYFTKPYLEEVLLDAAQRMLNGEVLMATSQEATQEA